LLAFAPGFFYLTLQFYDEFAYFGLIHWLDQTEGFIENASLVFGPIWKASDGTQFSIIKGRARRSHTCRHSFVDRQSHGGNARQLKCSRYE